MAKEDIKPYQHNLALRQEFNLLGLDLNEVMEFTPFDLDLENQRLEQLLDFVDRYRKYGDREVMDVVEGEWSSPPIFPGISPDSDWYRFDLWLQGQPVRKKLSEQLPKTFVLIPPEGLSDEEISVALEQLETAMDQSGYGVGLNEGIPARLVYDYLLESLDETYELGPQGGSYLDGCSGYCPGCFQRPWCSTGESACWIEDELAGKMSLIDALSPYVSASPQSLAILRKLQAIEDAHFAKFKLENIEFDDFKQREALKAALN